MTKITVIKPFHDLKHKITRVLGDEYEEESTVRIEELVSQGYIKEYERKSGSKRAKRISPKP